MADPEQADDDELDHLIAELVRQHLARELAGALPKLETALAKRVGDQLAAKLPAGAGEGISRKDAADLILKAAGKILKYLDSEPMRLKIRAQALDVVRQAGLGSGKGGGTGGGPSREDVELMVVETVALAHEDPTHLETIRKTAREEARLATSQGAGSLTRDEAQALMAAAGEKALARFLESDGLTHRILELAPGGASPGEMAQAAHEAVREAMLGEDFLAVISEAFDVRFSEFREDIQRAVDQSLADRVRDLLHDPAMQQVLKATVQEESERVLSEARREVGDRVAQARERIATDTVRALRQEIAKEVAGHTAGPEFMARAAEIVRQTAESRRETEPEIQALVEREVAARVEEFLNSEAVARKVASRVQRHLPGTAHEEPEFLLDDGETSAGSPMHHPRAVPEPRHGPEKPAGFLAKVKRLHRG